MEVITTLLLCAAIPAAVGILAVGIDAVFELCIWNFETVRKWHDKQISLIEQWQEDEEL